MRRPGPGARSAISALDGAAGFPDTRAIVLDVDGTLYRQAPVRRNVAWRLRAAHAARPRHGLRTLRVLRAYRLAQEALRASTGVDHPALSQRVLAAAWAGVSPVVVDECIEQWMEQAPLDLVVRARRPGLDDLVAVAHRRGLRLAVCSLPGCRNAGRAQPRERDRGGHHAQDPEVGEFKPSPRRLRMALSRLGISALYVGDRPTRAGIPCLLIGRLIAAFGASWTALPGFPELARALEAAPDA